jgi:hypothetical protein
MNMLNQLSRLTMATLIAALAACGGGGGDSGGGSGSNPPPASQPVSITSTNADDVAGVGFQSAIGVVDSSSLATGSSASVALAARPKSVLGKFTVGLTRTLLEAQQSPASVTSAVTVMSCPSGGSYTVNSADDGSAYTVTYNDCYFDPDYRVSGTVTVTGIAGDETSFSATVSYNLTIAVTGEPPLTYSGGYSFQYTDHGTTVTATISGSNLTVSDGTNTITVSNYSFSYSENTQTGVTTTSANLTVASSELGGSVTIETLTPFQTYSYASYPHAGVMQITGANGSRLRMTVNGNELYAPANQQVRLEIDANGDGAYETTTFRSWAEIDS